MSVSRANDCFAFSAFVMFDPDKILVQQNSGKTSTDVRGRDMGVEEGTGK